MACKISLLADWLYNYFHSVKFLIPNKKLVFNGINEIKRENPKLFLYMCPKHVTDISISILQAGKRRKLVNNATRAHAQLQKQNVNAW